MKKHFFFSVVYSLFLGLHVSAQFQNVLVGQYASETTIAIDPLNTNQMVAGANTTNYYYSTDAGQSWTNGHLTSPWGNAGDPNVVTDGAGNFFYLHLANSLDRIIAQGTTVFPPAWNSGTYTGLTTGPPLQDHEWAYADWNNHYLYTTWTQYDQYPPQSTLDSSHILFSASYDQGQSWTTAIRLDERGGDEEYLDVIEPRPATDVAGNVYVTWASAQGLMLDKSNDYGASWRSADQVITAVPGGVYYSIPGINRIRSTPFVAIDKSTGPHQGTIYVSWCDQSNGMSNTDVWMIKSTDAGASWSTPLRVNDDLTVSHQFLNAMAVDDVTGSLYICFYDRRNYASDTTDFYLAWSDDGGNTFSNRQINQQPFVVNQSSFFGDYIGIAAHNNVVRPCWAAFDAFGAASVYTALIDGPLLGTSEPTSMKFNSELMIAPGIVSSGATLRFALQRSSDVAIEVYDLEGKRVKDLFHGHFPTGYNSVPVNLEELREGVYICAMTTPSQRLTTRFAVMR